MRSIILLQVYPLVQSSTNDVIGHEDSCLSSPVVKSYLSTEQIHILWDKKYIAEKECKVNREQYTLSATNLGVYQGTVFINRRSKLDGGKNGVPSHVSEQNNIFLPMVVLPSQDPTVFSGVSCLLRACCSELSSSTTKKYGGRVDDPVLSKETLVQIMPPIIALQVNERNKTCMLDMQFHLGQSSNEQSFGYHPSRSLKDSLFGISPLSYCNEDLEIDKQVLSCSRVEIQRALLLRMKKMMKYPILVGTTHDSYIVRSNMIERSAKLHKAMHLQEHTKSIKHEIQKNSRYQIDSTKGHSSFEHDVALTVYDDTHGSNKSALVIAISRSVLKCHATHVINSSVIFTKFGASAADIALETILHQIVVSTAIQALARDEIGSICIILDQFDSFVPCSNTEASTPALNAIGAYLSKLLHSVKSKRLFPFPSRNPYYNVRGRKGFLFPVKICIVGIVTCESIKVKETNQNNRSILDILGSNIFCISTEVDRSNANTTQKQYISQGNIFKSVGGIYTAKKMLEDVLAIDLRKQALLNRFGLCLPTGVLLYGPPGTGKTLLAKATSNLVCNQYESDGTFIALNASDIVCAEIGKSEKLLQSTFEIARKKAPSVIFIDEFQALFTSRDKGNGSGTKGSGRLASTLLTLMDDIVQWQNVNSMVVQKEIKRVVILAATNTPWLIDGAFLRSGRFDRVVHVKLPTLLERKSILKVHLSKMKLAKGSDIDEISAKMASDCEGYSGADLSNLVRAAASQCLHSFQSEVTMNHFLDAKRFDVMKPSSDANLVSRLNKWKP